MLPTICLASCPRPFILLLFQRLFKYRFSQNATRESPGGDSHLSHSTVNISRSVSVSLSVVPVHLSMTDVLKLTSTLSWAGPGDGKAGRHSSVFKE